MLHPPETTHPDASRVRPLTNDRPSTSEFSFFSAIEMAAYSDSPASPDAAYSRRIEAQPYCLRGFYAATATYQEFLCWECAQEDPQLVAGLRYRHSIVAEEDAASQYSCGGCGYPAPRAQPAAACLSCQLVAPPRMDPGHIVDIVPELEVTTGSTLQAARTVLERHVRAYLDSPPHPAEAQRTEPEAEE